MLEAFGGGGDMAGVDVEVGLERALARGEQCDGQMK